MQDNRFDGHAVYFGAGERDPEFIGYMELLSDAARPPGSPWRPTGSPMPGTPGRPASRGLPGGLDFLASPLGHPAVSPGKPARTAGDRGRRPFRASGRQGVRQSLGHLRAIPFTLAVLAVFLVTGAATGSFLSGPPDALLRRGVRQCPGAEGRALVVAVHLDVLRHEPAGLRSRPR